MSDIPDYALALKQFRHFLAASALPDKVLWVFRDDLWQRSWTRVFVKYPPPPENLSLVQKVFAEGRERGLVEMTAIAATAEDVVATVWFPKYAEQEVQGWGRGMKLTHREPLPRATTIGAWMWRLIQLLPEFKRYQSREFFIGTRTWAAA